MSMPLLMTKLYIPSPGKYLVRRACLDEKLNQCLEPGCRLTLISAPAGFGKTTLISAWLAGPAAGPKNAPSDWLAAWLSLADGENDPAIFWTYLISALQTQQKDLGQQTLNLLAVQGGDLEGKLAALINDLIHIPYPLVMVLDDYHLIRSPAIHQSLSFFIEHLPPHFHLMIASRTDPPLPLALLRGRGQLLEIRLNDLRFTDEDADAYLNAGIGLNLAAQSVSALNRKTEGWIAGLQMATLAMQDMSRQDTAALPGQNRKADFVASFSGSNRFILDYLIEEVLNRQPAQVQQFLIQTSILDQLCGPLCDALLQDSGAAVSQDAQPALEYLESCNLFIFPLDQQRYWYRYHHLFADLLRKRLTQAAPEMAAELHRRAIHWYEQNGFIPSAIQHAFHLRDFHKAAALIAQVTEAMWGRGEHATLLGWLDALPNQEKEPYPSLLIFQVSMLISAGKLQDAAACIPTLERGIAAALEANPDQTALIGNISAQRTYIASFYNDLPSIFSHAHTALQYLTGDGDAGQRCGVSLILGNAYLIKGALDAAVRAFGEAIAAGNKARKPHMVLTGLSNLVVVLWLQGNLRRGAQICQEGQSLIEQFRFNRSPMAADISLGWGEVYRERGALKAAEPQIQAGLVLAQEQQYISQIAWGYLAQARLLVAQVKLHEAETAAQAAMQWADAHEVPAHFACGAAGLLAELWLRQGKTTQAARYLQARGIQADGDITFPHQFELLAMARLLWMQGEPARALQLLDRIYGWADSHHQTGTMMAALLLQAMIHPSGARGQEGMPFLERALEFGKTHEYFQIFIDEGDPIDPLLRAAVQQNISPDYVLRLLAQFSDISSGAVTGSQPVVEPRPQVPHSSETLPLVEPLSRREIETLQSIAEGYSNKEIAQKLCISLRTVKYYSTGLYNKLGVDGRMQAVIRARELGLL